MALREMWRKWVGAGVAAAALAGCGKDAKPKVAVQPKDLAPTASVPGDAAAGPAVAVAVTVDPKMHMSFDEACINEIAANVPLTLPPDVTYTGKNCGHLNDEVARTWKSIKYVTDDGKAQTYIAELEVVCGDTAVGTIEMLMRPEIAPSHVRN